MLRFDDCLCGTSTTGTGTLTLAAIPSGAGGGIDPDVWARATGIGFGNSAALLVDYVITEFTDNTFATEKSKEAGTGTLTLVSPGIANATLARTTIDWTATSLNSQPASVSVKPGTGITIGTAANTLVTISPRAESVPGYEPYHNNEGDSNWGISPDGFESLSILGNSIGFVASTVRDFYVPFRWSVPMLVKRCTFRINAFSTVTGSPITEVRLYATGTNGRPGKKLYDFTPSGGVAITGTGNFATGAAGNGFLLTPGDYWLDLCTSGMTGGSINFACSQTEYRGHGSPTSNRMGASSGTAFSFAIASGASGAGPDPANLTSWAAEAFVSVLSPPVFGLNDA